MGSSPAAGIGSARLAIGAASIEAKPCVTSQLPAQQQHRNRGKWSGARPRRASIPNHTYISLLGKPRTHLASFGAPLLGLASVPQTCWATSSVSSAIGSVQVP